MCVYVCECVCECVCVCVCVWYRERDLKNASQHLAALKCKTKLTNLTVLSLIPKDLTSTTTKSGGGGKKVRKIFSSTGRTSLT